MNPLPRILLVLAKQVRVTFLEGASGLRRCWIEIHSSRRNNPMFVLSR